MDECKRTYINDRAVALQADSFCCLFFSGLPLMRFHQSDNALRNFSMVVLVEEGLAKTNEVAKAFDVHRSTIFRNQKKVAEGGIAALVAKKSGPQGGSKIKEDMAKLLLKLKSQGMSNRAIAHNLGYSEAGVRNALKRLGYREKQEPGMQISLELSPGKVTGGSDENALRKGMKQGEETKATRAAEEGALGQEIPQALQRGDVSADNDPSNRIVDRLLARMGLLEDAAPLFGKAARADCAGFLLAVPFLYSSGIFEIARKVYGSLGPAFYGLRSIMLTLLMMAIIRIKRPEELKETSPAGLGQLLGLDRAPEVKTLRRKLTTLAAFGKAYEFLRLLFRHRVKQHRSAVGYLYVDGFVRVYYGKRRLPKTYVAQRRLPMAGVTDYWINDQKGDPLFVVTAKAHEGLTAMLKPLVKEIQGIVGKRRCTIVFDRGGWSPKLFKELLEMKVDIMTYRKGKCRKVARRLFEEHSIKVQGHTHTWQLCDQAVRLLRGKLRLRQVTCLREGNHQTQVITSRWDEDAAMVLYRMFNRWRQENFFKYMRQEYALDVLADYNFQKPDSDMEVPNPKRKEIAGKLKAARSALTAYEQHYGEEALSRHRKSYPRPVAARVIAERASAMKVMGLRRKVKKLENAYHSIPKRIAARDAYEGTLVRLSYERKLITDAIKIVAYQAEGALVALIKPLYARTDQEGRTLITSFFQNTGLLEIKDDTLIVTLDPLSSPHRTKVLELLCSKLNKYEAKFPGTNYTIEFKIQQREVA